MFGPRLVTAGYWKPAHATVRTLTLWLSNLSVGADASSADDNWVEAAHLELKTRCKLDDA